MVDITDAQDHVAGAGKMISGERLDALAILYADYATWDNCEAAQDGEIATALRELKALREQCEWRPIETAPKDGTRVLLGFNGFVTSHVGFYLDNSRTSPPWSGWRGTSLEPFPNSQPTHWMPFPCPPSSSGAKPE